MSGPNWCEPCGRYHPRDYQDCARRLPPPPPPPATQVPLIRGNVDQAQLARIPEASDHRYVAGWVAGYGAAMSDQHELAAQ